MKRGDIYLVSLDPTAGHEQCGSRPVLVVSPTEFNEATKLPVILPITKGGEFARRLGFAVPLAGMSCLPIAMPAVRTCSSAPSNSIRISLCGSAVLTPVSTPTLA